MTQITPISVIGSCVANQVVRQMPGYKRTHQMFYDEDNDVRFREKMSFDTTPPGNIADRLYDEMWKSEYMSNWHKDPMAYDIKTQLEYVIKSKSIQATINNAKLTPGGVIYVDLTNELLPSVITQDEEFLLKNNWQQLAPHFPDWFRDLVIKNTFQFDMYDKTMTLKRHHALRRAVEIINSADLPVVALGNVYTNRIYDYISGTVVENLSFYNDKIPFLKVDRTGRLSELVNYNYIKEQIDGFYRICQSPKMSPGWTWVNVEEDCYADPMHEYGPHPIHLHIEPRRIIGSKLQDAFNKQALVGARCGN